MSYETLNFEITDGLAVITMNRPDKMNALNAQMRAEINDAVAVAEKSARCIVLTGSGSAFCSGQDLSDQGNLESMDLERILRDEYTPMLRRIVECRVPTIAAVNGAAAGAGANLALAFDVVIAAERAYFMQAFSRIGLIPDAGGTYYLPRKIGQAKALGAALFAEKITATEASDMGLIWEAVADDQFEAQWKKRAAHLALGPTVAYRYIKEAIRGSFDKNFEDQLVVEARLQGKCGATRDFKEGVLAFLEKRPAQYEGR